MSRRKVIFPPTEIWTRNTAKGRSAMNPKDLRSLDHSELLALLIAATDDLLRLCAAVTQGDADSYTQADAQVLADNWSWPEGNNTYSDGTVIVATDTRTHIYAPPHHRHSERTTT